MFPARGGWICQCSANPGFFCQCLAKCSFVSPTQRKPNETWKPIETRFADIEKESEATKKSFPQRRRRHREFFRQDLQDGQDLWGFRRRGRRESEEFRTFRRGYHGNGFRRLTPWIQILRATGQNETLKPMESRLRQTLKKGNSVPRGRGGITNGRKKGCEKKISAKNQGIFGDSGESVKGTDPVNSLKTIESRLRRTLKKESRSRDRGESREGGQRAKKKISAKNQGTFGDSGESVKGTDPVIH